MKMRNLALVSALSMGCAGLGPHSVEKRRNAGATYESCIEGADMKFKQVLGILNDTFQQDEMLPKGLTYEYSDEHDLGWSFTPDVASAAVEQALRTEKANWMNIGLSVETQSTITYSCPPAGTTVQCTFQIRSDLVRPASLEVSYLTVEASCRAPKGTSVFLVESEGNSNQNLAALPR